MNHDIEMQIPTARKYAFIAVRGKMTIKKAVETYYELSEAYWKEQKRRASKKNHD